VEKNKLEKAVGNTDPQRRVVLPKKEKIMKPLWGDDEEEFTTKNHKKKKPTMG